MRLKSIINIIALFLLLFLVYVPIAGCKKFVEIPPPTTQVVTASVFNNSATATAAQLGIYINMWQASYSMSVSCGMLSDELVNHSTNLLNIQYYTNSMTAVNSGGGIAGPWNNGGSYNYIYAANAVIEGLKDNGNIATTITNQLTGEAKFTRAFWHSYLAACYGDVPLVLSTDYTVNKSIARSPRATVFNQVITDLQDAQNLLNVSYVDKTDTAVTTERVRPNKAAAQALLARVYLYAGKYDSAELMATTLINNPLYSLCPNLSGPVNSVFLSNSTEAIWQLSTPIASSYSTPDGQFYFLKAAPSTGTTNFTNISSFLLNAFEPNDQRETQWLGLYTASDGTQYYFPYKYQAHDVATSAQVPTEYVMMLRLAEQYLIRAEARAQQNNLGPAVDDLNVIRQRAGLPLLDGTTMSQSQVLAAVLQERRVELFTEWGHRWFDLSRMGAIDTVMGTPGNVYTLKGGVGNWSSTWSVFPVPQSEILVDQNLTQNAGY